MSARWASIAGIAAAALAITSVVLFGVVIGFDPSAGAETFDRLAAASPEEVGFVRWGAITDMLGYYLLPAAVVVAVRDRIPWRSDAARDVATAAFLVYATVGSIGAAILAVVRPPLIEPGAQASVSLVAQLLVVEALWHWLEPVPFFTWALMMAIALRDGPILWKTLFAVLACGAVFVWFGRILDVDPLLVVGLGLWLFPFPLVFAAAATWASPPSALKDRAG